MMPITHEIYTIPAGQLSLEAIADIFSAAFEGYYYPGTLTPQDLARRVRLEQIDLWRSPVLVEGERPVGIALVALRGARAWCGGFGVYAAQRGRGLAHTLAAAMVAQAREAGARTLALEVLTRNEAAIRTYQRAGLATVRDLQVLEWRRPEGWAPERPAAPVAEIAVGEALAHFAALHPARPAWQRDLPTLLTIGDLRALAIVRGGGPEAYLLLGGPDGGRIRIADLGARTAGDAEALLAAAQARADSLVSINEPAESPITVAFAACGFSQIDRQHEMERDLEG